MGRGFLSGVIWGLVVALIAVAALSLQTPPPQPPSVDATAPEASESALPQEVDREDDPKGADPDLVEIPPTAPGAETAKADDLSSLDEADTQPAAVPEVGGTAGALDKPSSAAEDAGVAVGSATPVVPVPPSGAPAAPAAEAELSIATEPAQPAAPQIAEASGFGATAPEADAAPSVTAATDPERDTSETATTVAEPSTSEAPLPTTAPAAAPETTAPAVTQNDAGAATGPEVAALPQTDADAPQTSGSSIGKPVVPLTERDTETNRIRLSGDADETEAPTASPADASGSDVAPLVRYAVPFENPDDKPLMAIVLIDDEKSFGSEALENFPYPLTFAVDPTDADAAEKMARYRAAGFEVVALINLPPSAAPQDAEVALSASFSRVPEVVAVLEGIGSGVQGNRPLAEQVAAIVGSTGHGLIMQDTGLNTVQKLAARDGVPSAVVFRDFDGAGQTPTVMRRFLDQAAFRAGQEGTVIMLGRVRPDTISALLLWGLQDRASRVMLAPVSAALMRTAAAQ